MITTLLGTSKRSDSASTGHWHETPPPRDGQTHCHTINPVSLPSSLRQLLLLLNILFIYLSLAALGLGRCTQLAFVAASSSCSPVAMRGLLTAMAPLAGEHRLLGAQASRDAAHGFSSCGSQAQWIHGMRNLPEPGIEPMSPALAGRFLTTGPPGKSF